MSVRVLPEIPETWMWTLLLVLFLAPITILCVRCEDPGRPAYIERCIEKTGNPEACRRAYEARP